MANARQKLSGEKLWQYKVGNVEFYAGPHDTGGPDNLEEIIVGFINGAQKRLEVAVQELESRPIADVLIAARRRKVLVKLVIEQDYLKRTRSKDDPWTPGGKNENNRSVHNAILRASIDVKVDYNTSIFIKSSSFGIDSRS